MISEWEKHTLLADTALQLDDLFAAFFITSKPLA